MVRIIRIQKAARTSETIIRNRIAGKVSGFPGRLFLSVPVSHPVIRMQRLLWFLQPVFSRFRRLLQTALHDLQSCFQKVLTVVPPGGDIPANSVQSVCAAFGTVAFQSSR